MYLFHFSLSSLKQTALLILTLFIFSACAKNSNESNSSESSQSTSSYKAELMALEKAWIDAEVNDDEEALERILDEQFVATFASGKTVDRSKYIEIIIKMDISPFSAINEAIHIHEDTAVIIDISTDRTTKFTWIAIKRNGEWKVISETFTRVTPNV